MNVKIVLLVIATGMLLTALPIYAQPRRIGVSLDGKRVDFYSDIMSEHIPALLVDTHVMLPVRFFDEALHKRLSLRLSPWHIIEVEDIAFKFGEKAAYRGAPGIGGERAWLLPLAVAPMVIKGRGYLPARESLDALGYSVQWDSASSTLVVESKRT